MRPPVPLTAKARAAEVKGLICSLDWIQPARPSKPPAATRTHAHTCSVSQSVTASQPALQARWLRPAAGKSNEQSKASEGGHLTDWSLLLAPSAVQCSAVRWGEYTCGVLKAAAASKRSPRGGGPPPPPGATWFLDYEKNKQKKKKKM